MVAMSGSLTFLSSRSSSITRSGPPARRQAMVGVLEAAAGQHRAALLHRGHDLLGVARVERPHVAAVHRGHRRHVARAQALEAADLGVLEPLLAGLLLDRLQ